MVPCPLVIFVKITILEKNEIISMNCVPKIKEKHSSKRIPCCLMLIGSRYNHKIKDV